MFSLVEFITDCTTLLGSGWVTAGAKSSRKFQGLKNSHRRQTRAGKPKCNG
jgi:hypothetical protein